MVYGARTVYEPGPSEYDVVGAAPADPRDLVLAGSDTLMISRESMPSLERRDARARRLTLLAYAAVIVASVLGLCAVGVLAFG